MSPNNLNSSDDNTDPLSSAAKHMDERLRDANQSAVSSLQTSSASLDKNGPTMNNNATPASSEIGSLSGLPTATIAVNLKAFLTLLTIPVVIGLFAGLCQERHPK